MSSRGSAGCARDGSAGIPIVDDRDFLDLLYQKWSKTSHAEKRYWAYERNTEFGDTFDISAVGEDGREWLGSFLRDDDADFMSAVHGCFPDLVKRLHDALDEADRADRGRDERECRIAELELQVQALTRP